MVDSGFWVKSTQNSEMHTEAAMPGDTELLTLNEGEKNVQVTHLEISK